MHPPSELDPSSGCPHKLRVHVSKLSCKYVGVGNHAQDVGAIQANYPISDVTAVYYFEVRILSSGVYGRITIGFTGNGFDNRLQPGTEPMSFGYHGKTGNINGNGAAGKDYGPKFTTGDVVGCGYNFRKQQIFFTKNGEDLGVAFRKIVDYKSLYPTIALHSRNEEVALIFGEECSADFSFQLDSVLEKERNFILCEKKNMLLPPDMITSLIGEYLLQNGYVDTHRAHSNIDAQVGVATLSLESSARKDGEKNKRKRSETGAVGQEMNNNENRPECGDGTTPSIDASQLLLTTLQFRGRLRGHILAGDIERTIELLRKYDHFNLDERPGAMFLLNCQSFIELCRQRDFVQAIAFVKTNLVRSAPSRKSCKDVDMHITERSFEQSKRCLKSAKWTNGDVPRHLTEEYLGSEEKPDLSALMSYKVKEVVGLLAYPDPKNSPLSYLFRNQHKEIVADYVNELIIGPRAAGSVSLERALCEWRAVDFFSRKHDIFVHQSLSARPAHPWHPEQSQ